MRQAWWRAGALAGVVLATAPRAGAVTLSYEVRWGPLHLLSVRTTTTVSASEYRVETEMRTVGLIGRLFPWIGHSRTAGIRAGEDFAPRRHLSSGRYAGADRQVDIAYGDGGAVDARVHPDAARDARDPVPEHLRQATIDPLTAGVATAVGPCRGRLRVFDGRRRYDMALEAGGTAEPLPSKRGVYVGVARRCRILFEPVAGFWRTDPERTEVPATLDVWIAPPQPDLPPSPVYLQLTGTRGTLKIDLTRVGPG